MRYTQWIAGVFLMLGAPGASADVPQVATDIGPVQSLVARVMDGVGTPDLIIRPGASPHGYALRPSEARALQQADLVVWMGEGLTPWMVKPIRTLAGQAQQIELLEVAGTHVLPLRAHGADMDHDHGHGHVEEHEDHDDEGHEDHVEDNHEGDAHDDESHDGEGHDDHGTFDTHAWLNPDNARIWLRPIADELARLDPDNAAAYRVNADAAAAELHSLTEEIAATLAPVRDIPFVSFHDAYHYFEDRFGLVSAGTVSPGDATDPSPAQLAALRDRIRANGVTCAFSEPQFDPALLRTASGDRDVTILQLDPLGSLLETGPALYPEMLRAMAQTMAECLGQ